MALGREIEPSGSEDWLETNDWIDSLRDVARRRGPERVSRLLQTLQIEAQRSGIRLPVTSQTPYVNTIPIERQPPYPGDLALERRIKSIIRWNAMAMVVEANQNNHGIGGHISTYASAATLYEVGFNHFFRGQDHPCGGDLVYFQGHSAPGIYARGYVEGRLAPDQLHKFRRELSGGLPSYPHPWLMDDYWQFPTVSMGLGPIQAIYQARFIRYLENRDLLEPTDRKVWCFLGDGETDEPETLGSIALASREELDNLVFVVNCNLQRLDGPVRGNGQIIQELEAVFRGVGWNVIKVIWGSEWDQLLARDDQGLLVQRMGEVVDGEYQKYTVAGGGYVRNHFWGVDPRLLRMVDDISDDELWRMRLGGHDPLKVHAAYRAAMDHRGAPTVILARTIKGYGLGEAGEGRNITHQQKELNEQELMQFRDRFAIPLSDDEVVGAPLYRPSRDSREATYISTRKEALGGHVPERRSPRSNLTAPPDETFSEFLEGTGDREASTTMGIVRMLSRLMRDRELGERIVPIVPDESRTFGMEGMFREFGIYASAGQLYEPVDSDRLLFYKESRDGQILEEGITEAGAMSSFIAGGMSYSSLQVPTIPFFIFYSMFGLQRFGDLAYAAGDSRARGFLIGATAGRTTLNGEGLQHQDGHSHLLASTIPNLIAYDPAYAYEIAVIVQDGIRRMHDEDESIFYYITVENEPYIQPPMPESEVVREGILRGIYPLVPSEAPQVRLLGSGPILNEVRAAQQILRDDFDIRADVWSVTSYTELRREALHTDRWNRYHPLEEPRRCWLETSLGQCDAPIVAASDYTASLPDLVARWLPGPLTALGTDGFGRSDTREALRDFFEVDANHIVWSALSTLNPRDEIDGDTLLKARDELGIDPNRPDPMMS
ncbi:MAG: pyruvate dehydrogenase (acetyl-transferring), homodimeric type [Chloroflexi bacterium]|nr:pyruvate dehydrogenase (acetyl-transferring), homodimeric type [Chloroflexota bacterium]MCY3697674.1 pyruvate dehydrogenase (acetyl-transferring), homodimeric type [Chloroflexota bacterium]